MKPALTRAFVRLVHRTVCDGTERLSLLDEPTLVYTYRSPDPPFAQVTPLGTVLWNTTYTDRLSPSARRVVLLHECGHRDRNLALRVVLAATTGFFGVGPLFVGRAVLLLARDGAPAEAALSGFVGLVLVLAAVLAVRLEEGLADYHALRAVGEARFLAAYDEIEAASPGRGADRLVARLVYPRPRTVIRFHRGVRHASRDGRSPIRLLYSFLGVPAGRPSGRPLRVRYRTTRAAPSTRSAQRRCERPQNVRCDDELGMSSSSSSSPPSWR